MVESDEKSCFIGATGMVNCIGESDFPSPSNLGLVVFENTVLSMDGRNIGQKDKNFILSCIPQGRYKREDVRTGLLECRHFDKKGKGWKKGCLLAGFAIDKITFDNDDFKKVPFLGKPKMFNKIIRMWKERNFCKIQGEVPETLRLTRNVA